MATMVVDEPRDLTANKYPFLTSPLGLFVANSFASSNPLKSMYPSPDSSPDPQLYTYAQTYTSGNLFSVN